MELFLRKNKNKIFGHTSQLESNKTIFKSRKSLRNLVVFILKVVQLYFLRVEGVVESKKNVTQHSEALNLLWNNPLYKTSEKKIFQEFTTIFHVIILSVYMFLKLLFIIFMMIVSHTMISNHNQVLTSDYIISVSLIWFF